MGRQARHGDLTARTKAELLAKHQAEQEAASRRMAMIDAQAQEVKEGVVDLAPNPPRSEDDLPPVKVARPAEEQETEPVNLGHAEDVQVEQAQVPQVEVRDVEEPKERLVTFRVNETIPQVTIGYGKTYDFVEGQKYRAPEHVYNHLEEKGLIYH